MELQSIGATNEPPGHCFIIGPCERSIAITLLAWPSSSILPRPSLLHPFLSLPSCSFIPFFCATSAYTFSAAADFADCIHGHPLRHQTRPHSGVLSASLRLAEGAAISNTCLHTQVTFTVRLNLLNQMLT